MTLSNLTTRIQYNGDDSTVAFPTVFPFLSNSDVVATLRASDGTETAWTEGVDYTLAGGGGATGTLTATTAPATGETLTINRVVPLTQETDYPEGGSFPSASHEAALDKLTMLAQQLDEGTDRALVFPITDPDTAIDELPVSVDRASMFLGFDANGKPIAAAGTSANLGPVTPFIDTLLDDADAATARATLGAAGDIDDNVLTGKNTFTGEFVLTKGSDIASAATITIPTDGNYFDVTGTTAITGMTVDAGRSFFLQFDGALVFTNGASLILPGADDILTAAGDVALCYAEAADTVRVQFFPATGQAIKPPSMRGVLWGLNVTNNAGDAAKDLDIAAGACMADDGSTVIELSSALVKQLDAAWAPGTNAGALDGTESVAGTPDASTWYHIWAIMRSDTGVVDVLASESATAPTMPANYDKKCLIWSVLFDATPDILPFDAFLDLCTWKTPINNYNADPGATEITTTVSTPLGLRTLAKLAVTALMTASGTTNVAVYYVGGSATAGAATGAQIQLTSNVSDSADDDAGSAEVQVPTDTSAQVNHISSTDVSSLQITTLGFIHPRGRA